MKATNGVLLALLIVSASHLLFAKASETCPAKLTAADAKGPFYLANIPPTGLLAPVSLLNQPEKVLLVAGTIYGDDCLPLSKVRVEAWYAGDPDDQGNFYSLGGANNDYRGSVVTDNCGAYKFTQTFPALYPSRPILHVHFRVSTVTDDQELLVTQMYFEGMVPTSFESSPSRALQIVSVDTAQDGVRSTVFNMYVNSPGTADSEICGIIVNATSASANSSSPVAPAQEEGFINPTATPTSTDSAQEEGFMNPTATPTSTDSSRAYARECFASFVIVPMASLLFHYVPTIIN
jgi:protocatechuate 3,4-dioxygenase beta subunit